MAQKSLPSLHDILLVEFASFRADRVKATLRATIGSEFRLHHAGSLTDALNRLGGATLDLIVLDQGLRADDLIMRTSQWLRRFGFGGPIIVVGRVIRRTADTLCQEYGVVVLDLDNVCSGGIAEALHTAFMRAAAVVPKLEHSARRRRLAPPLDRGQNTAGHDSPTILRGSA